MFEVQDGMFGVRNESGQWNGLIGTVLRGVSTDHICIIIDLHIFCNSQLALVEIKYNCPEHIYILNSNVTKMNEPNIV